MRSAARETFVAIDFETATDDRTSACSVGLVRVEGERVVAREHRLIRPPSRRFDHTHIHRITWEQVAREPAFGEVWDAVAPLVDGADYLAAHNAAFDRGVLDACLALGRRPPFETPFLCTVRLARRVLGFSPANLPAVCRRLGIPLEHHDALSDAEACARIVIEARRVDPEWKARGAEEATAPAVPVPASLPSLVAAAAPAVARREAQGFFDFAAPDAGRPAVAAKRAPRGRQPGAGLDPGEVRARPPSSSTAAAREARAGPLPIAGGRARPWPWILRRPGA